MLFGVAYYPEHWDKKDWKRHARLMREGNFNVARIAEFAWGRIEPEEDRFDFAWLDEAIDTLAAEGINVILGTPTASPPKWLADKYDVYLRDRYGRARGFGSRRQCCSNHPDYIERSIRVVEKMAEHYKDHPNVIAWQIDNEFGCHGSTQCYCEHCKQAFSRWLEARYHDITALNTLYGTVFWSQEYRGFDDVILPAYTSCEPECGHSWAHNPSLDMDFYRFSSDSWVNYQQLQIDIIRKYSGAPITHNMMGHFSDIDYNKLGKPLDIVSWDNYIDNQWNHETYENTSMAHELMRGVKNQNFWIVEQQSGQCGWDMYGGTPRPGQLRLWTYQAIAHGCEGLLYFRFKSVPFGMEQYWHGVIDHDGIPRRRYAELQQTGAELKHLAPLFMGAQSKTDVLIVKSYEHVWSHAIKQHKKEFDYRELLYAYYKANNHLGTNPACGSEEMISSQYQIVYLPACIIVSEALEKRLEEYVMGGGCLVLTYRSGIKDENNNICTSTMPGRLRKLSGVTVEEFDTSPVQTALSGGFGSTGVWRDILKTETAQTAATYESEYYKGSAAITRNQYGKGTVWYVGCDLTDDALFRLVKTITEKAGVQYMPHPEGTEIIRRSADNAEYTMLLNYTDEEKEMQIRGTSLFDGKPFDGRLGAYSVAIIEDRENK
jgi:beta-galactosidase